MLRKGDGELTESRLEVLKKIWNAQDEAYELMVEYDELPHHYGDHILYQSEGEIINLIGIHPGATITDLGNILRKTVSACSQTVRKLREKGFVEQTRNRDNNRQYNLTLTEAGKKLYEDHLRFSENCQQIEFGMLDEFTEEELAIHLKVQKRINEAYAGDVKRSRERFTRG